MLANGGLTGLASPGMDFGSAALLIASVFVIVELLGKLFPELTAREKVAAAIIVGQIDVVLVAHSAWGSKQVVEGVALSSMNWASLALVGIAIAGLAVVGKQALQSISNIGQNHTDAP